MLDTDTITVATGPADTRRVHADRLAGELIGLVKRVERAGHHAAAEGVERAAYALLAVLVTTGPLRAKSLAEVVRSDPSTVSRQIAALVRVGYVERRADQADGRAAVLAATVLGRQTFEAHRARRTDRLAALTAHWPEDDLARLAELVHRLAEDLDPPPSPDTGRTRTTHPGSTPKDTSS